IRDFHVTGVQTCALPIFVEDDVRARVGQAERRKPKDWSGPHPWSRNRRGWLEPVELTSREKTEKIKQSKARLAARYLGAAEPVRSEERRGGEEGGARPSP